MLRLLRRRARKEEEEERKAPKEVKEKKEENAMPVLVPRDRRYGTRAHHRSNTIRRRFFRTFRER